MKKNILKPFAVMTLSSFVMFSCASSGENATAMEESTTISETETMAGSTTENASNIEGYDVLVVEEQVTVPIVTLSTTALIMDNPIEVDQMFEDISNTESYDVLELAKTSPNLSTFVKLIEQAQLADDIQRVEEVTLFAPTNEAFASMSKQDLEQLLMADNYAALSRMLQNHIVSSDVSSTQLYRNDRIRISDSNYIELDSDADLGSTRIGGANIIKNDIKASNGRIHVIDAIIQPTTNDTRIRR